jgi:peptide/nickel transport system substrate-binding protein
MILRRQMTRSVIFFLIATAFLFSACQSGTPAASVKSTPEPTRPPTVEPSPEPRSLTICLGQEPNTLYLYGGPNAAARSVLSAIYDGPIDFVGYEYKPVILKKLPSLADGDAVIESVSVNTGSEVVDADGQPATLSEGTRVYPSGCYSDACAVTYDGKSPLNMDQMVVTFAMRDDVVWSDGTPVTAADSVYAFELNQDPSTPASKYLVDRTQSYEATDDYSLQWWGKPGFIDQTYFTNFWTPAPQHLWESFSPTDLLETDVSTREPAGWGPYILQEWKPGESIRLTRNRLYFRADEGLPKFANLTFRFVSDADTAVSDLLAGKCDLLDPSVQLDSQVGLLRELQQSQKVQLAVAKTNIMEQLALGIKPAAYDDGYYPSPSGDRPDFLGDPRTRQAIAMCLDRQRVVQSVLFDLSVVPDSFLPPGNPEHSADLKTYQFDVESATQLLDQVGWKDTDNNPATPRVAQSVSGVPQGTPLVLNYQTTESIQRRQVSEILRQSLALCGIGVNLQYLSSADFYAQGPDGPLFGRSFDLAEFAMGTAGMDSTCEWYTTSAIPDAENHWLGTNVSGYSNQEFDQACLISMKAPPNIPAFSDAIKKSQQIFADDLPVIPLYLRLQVAASRPDFCNFDLTGTGLDKLWNLESFDYGTSCTP